MYAEAKKLHIIEEILKVENDTVLAELESVLTKSKVPSKPRSFRDFVGVLSDEELEAFERNINEGCEQINEDDWK